jgi:hypothetical protein
MDPTVDHRDRTDLDDLVTLRVEPGGFEVDRPQHRPFRNAVRRRFRSVCAAAT